VSTKDEEDQYVGKAAVQEAANQRYQLSETAGATNGRRAGYAAKRWMKVTAPHGADERA